MSAVKLRQPMSAEDYLAGELVSPVKHEYLAGRVYAMSGARNVHNILATNIVVAVGMRLRGKRCRPFNSDTKIRIPQNSVLRFYYPDASVVCKQNPQGVSYQERPVVIFEVISDSTRRIDEGEKKEAYLSLPSLAVYALVERETALITVYRRQGDDFNCETYQGLEATLPLPEVETSLPLAEIYEGAEFSPEQPDQ